MKIESIRLKNYKTFHDIHPDSQRSASFKHLIRGIQKLQEELLGMPSDQGHA